MDELILDLDLDEQFHNIFIDSYDNNTIFLSSTDGVETVNQSMTPAQSIQIANHLLKLAGAK